VASLGTQFCFSMREVSQEGFFFDLGEDTVSALPVSRALQGCPVHSPVPSGPCKRHPWVGNSALACLLLVASSS
jgi:hypothetical protein